VKRFKTDWINQLGDDKYPIYFIEMDEGFGLDCEFEIYAPVWYDIYMDSLIKWGAGDLEEVEW
jgi:hypothetical protein